MNNLMFDLKYSIKIKLIKHKLINIRNKFMSACANKTHSY